MEVQDFVAIEQRAEIAILWLDNRQEKMNIVSPAVMQVFETVFSALENDDSVKAAVIISRKKDFIAGADIKSFAIEKKGDFRPIQARGHQLLDRLEKGNKPIVAAISGACVGLGTELALACHGRILSNSPKTFMGLPEVKIGILPGGGGTQRLPRLVGIQKALDMMLTGKNIYAYRAKKWGLADALTAPDKLLHAALIMARRLLDAPIRRKPRLSLVDQFLEGTGTGRSILFQQARKMALKRSQGNYPAIPAILDCVETSYRKGLKAGYEKELELFEPLLLSEESKALRALFFANTENKKNPFGPATKPIQTLGMIGAGFMGVGIAEVSVVKDIDVFLKDVKAEVIAAAYKSIWESLQKKVKQKALTKVQAEEQIGRLRGQLDYDHFDQSDIVIEAVLEKMSLKKKIIEEIETHCREDVIIATNTSSLSVTEMAEHAKRPEQVIGMHYFSPVPKMPLLEIIRTKKTAKSVVAACYDFGLKQGKTCIVVNDGPGFYVNRILSPYLNECLTMVDEGLSIEIVDKALVKKGFPVGPLNLLDQVGLDIAAHSTESTRPQVSSREGFEVCESVIKMVEAGWLGRKNGKGFYTYNPKTKKRKTPNPDAYQFFKGAGKQSLPQEEIQNRALMLMINEAVMCLEEKIISSPTDGDLGAVFGIGFLPFTGGPFRHIDTTGVQNIVEMMNTLHEKYGARFKPRPLLEKMAGEEEYFYS